MSTNFSFNLSDLPSDARNLVCGIDVSSYDPKIYPLQFNPADYAGFSSREDWITAAKNSPKDLYLAAVSKAIQNEDAVLEEHRKKLQRRLENPNQEEKKDEGGIETHHIVPRFEEPVYLHEAWNLVKVTRFTHLSLHEIRFGVFRKIQDAVVSRFGPEDEDNKKKRLALSHATQKRDKTGVFNPEHQKMAGKKGGATKSLKKDEAYAATIQLESAELFKKGCVFVQTKTKPPLRVVFAPGEIQTTRDLFARLKAEIERTNNQEICAQFLKHTNANLTSGVSRILRKERKSAWGWKIEQ